MMMRLTYISVEVAGSPERFSLAVRPTPSTVELLNGEIDADGFIDLGFYIVNECVDESSPRSM